jgi:hypothetical protein
MSARSENRYKANSVSRFYEESAKAGEATALGRPARQPAAKAGQQATASRRKARGWMRQNATEYETATELAEATAAALVLPPGALDDPEHWIWDEAFEAMATF